MLHIRPTTFLASAVTFWYLVYWISRFGYSSDSQLLGHLRSMTEPQTGLMTDETQGSNGGIFQIQPYGAELPKPQFAPQFPRQIWQTSLLAGLDKYSGMVESWKSIPGYKHHWLSGDGITSFVHAKFSQRPSIVDLWDDLSSPHQIVLRANLLRYLLMLSDGGIYTAVDTAATKHPGQWIPSDLEAQEVNAVIGIESDKRISSTFARPITFCQRTLMAKPNHPIFTAAVDRVLSNLAFLAHQQKTSISELNLSELEILEATGTGVITDVVIQIIRDSNPNENISWSAFQNLRTPTLFGDVLVLPINAFGGDHTLGGEDPKYGEVYVFHDSEPQSDGPNKPDTTSTRPEETIKHKPGGPVASAVLPDPESISFSEEELAFDESQAAEAAWKAATEKDDAEEDEQTDLTSASDDVVDEMEIPEPEDFDELEE